MRKLVLLLTTVFLMIGMVSAAFVELDENGSKEKVKAVEKGNKGGGNFVKATGDTLKGAIRMAGNALTGLPYPQDPSDAATKEYVDEALSNASSSNTSISTEGLATEEYVDEKVSSISTGNGSTVVNSSLTLSDVVENGNIVDNVIEFSEGVMLGDDDTEAVEDAVAIGNGAEALEDNSVALGQDSRVNSSDTVGVGSPGSEMDLKVSGDLEVDGDIEGVDLNQSNSSDQGDSREVWSYSFATDTNGTEVIVPDEAQGQDYGVSVTPVDTLTDVGIFNRTEEDFYVKAGEFTKVDVLIAKE